MGAEDDRQGEAIQGPVRRSTVRRRSGDPWEVSDLAMLDRLLHKPITGGLFGSGRYALASMPCVARGLHATRYMVVEPQAGAVLSIADDKVEALAGARRVLAGAAVLQEAENETKQLELGLVFHDQPEGDCEPGAEVIAISRVSRRRQEVFDKSRGRCHYCGTALTLDGKWHVEHMMPRALGGNDQMVNLVAACVSCNLEKSDRTAIEFVSQRAA